MRQELTEVLGPDTAGSVTAHLVHGNAADILLRAAHGAEVLVVGSRAWRVRPRPARVREPARVPARPLPPS